ncbi:MAG TPA: Lrp/AsnC family transcriptional regulator [Planctomycetota bacterium]|nr:Lrp/AsnC family transcriptional regulator [Planctomycetota bacterium]
MPELDEKSKLLLNVIQDELPLVERPFKALGEKIGASEDEVLERVRTLKAQKILRQISTIFDTRSLGWQSSLVACKAPEGKADDVAEVLNQHPGVSHNYARKHDFSIWFTIAVPGENPERMQAHMDVLQKLSGAQSIRLMPTLRLFKIGMKIDMTGGQAKKMGLDDDSPMYSEKQRNLEKPPLTEKDIRYVLALQNDMEVRPDPYAPIAEKLGTTVDEMFDWCREFIKVGRMRRVAGIMNHRHAGFRANGMGVWNVPKERVEEVGMFFGTQGPITHCYLRPQYPDWRFNVFTMVHSQKVASCDEYLAGLSKQTGVPDYAILYSYKEYKKIRLLYFTGEIEAWEKQNGIDASRYQ